MTTHIETIRYLWKQQLEQPFDAAELLRIKNEYDRQVKMDATYRKLYDIHRVAYYAERKEVEKRFRERLNSMTKAQVAQATGFAGYSSAQLKRLTKEEMIGSYIFSKLSDTVKSDHDRVKEHWARLSDAQKLGEEPIDA